jgi:UDP-N-acetylglucosamine--N-acetylmuramyl-(pentapeptide) pyrophosphoryl-undecaprenol N-acetylglucosamine transferase
MEMAYQWADLLICRAGASTVTEVAAAGIAAIFVPLPSAIDDHQTANASSLAESGAAWLIPQTELGKSRTVSLLVSLTRDALTDRAGKARSLCIPNATERVADCVTTLARPIGSTGGVRP